MSTFVPTPFQCLAPSHSQVVTGNGYPVSDSAIGCNIQQGNHYKVKIVYGNNSVKPDKIHLTGPSCFRFLDEGESMTNDDNSVVHWLNFDTGGADQWPWFVKGFFSRVESLLINMRYNDGRRAYQQRICVVITPGLFWYVCTMALLLVPSLVWRAVTHYVALVQTDSPINPQLVQIGYQLLYDPVLWFAIACFTVGLVFIAFVNRIGVLLQWRRKLRKSEL